MKRHSPPASSTSATSWEPVKKWYNKAVGKEGHYYHQRLVIPGILRLMQLKQTSQPSLLDLACGQGVLGRAIPKEVSYCGIDIASGLIKTARQYDQQTQHRYLVGDVSKPLPLSEDEKFTHAAIVLALQNIEEPGHVIVNARRHLAANGRLFIVLNHPCFRIPRQSSWEVDAQNKLRYRRINRYASSMKIPVQAHPSQGDLSPVTWTFHHTLGDYTKWLHEAGFVIEQMEEWYSDKVSVGTAAKMENRSREEIPLFLTLVVSAVKRLPLLDRVAHPCS
jgi:SAM-dependent methyltransferase